MIQETLRNFNYLRLTALLGFSASAASAASTATYPGSQYFTASSVEMVVDITIDDTSNGITSIGQFYDFNDSDPEGFLTGSLTYGSGQGSGSSGVSLANDVTGPLIQVTAQSVGNYTPSDPDEIQVIGNSAMDFEIQYNDTGAGATVEATAVICLMPIRLSLTVGDAVMNPASASYSYYLEIDGSEIFASSMRLSQTSTGAVQLTNLEGDLRTDGIFFQSGNTKGFDFPAITIERSMGIFGDGDVYEGRITFSATTKVPDANWGAYAGAQTGGVDQSAFIPKVGSPVPEPQSVLLLLSGLLVMRARRRS